jgi:hypothetical protein
MTGSRRLWTVWACRRYRLSRPDRRATRRRPMGASDRLPKASDHLVKASDYLVKASDRLLKAWDRLPKASAPRRTVIRRRRSR